MKDTFTPPGLPIVSMDAQDIGPTLQQRIGRDAALTDATGVVQRPAAYEDPEQMLGMLQYHLNSAKQEGNKNGIAFYTSEIAKVVQAAEAQRQRLLQMYKPNMSTGGQ